MKESEGQRNDVSPFSERKCVASQPEYKLLPLALWYTYTQDNKDLKIVSIYYDFLKNNNNINTFTFYQLNAPK